MHIIDLRPEDLAAREQVAQLLVDIFPQAWPDMGAAGDEVNASLAPDRVSRVAMDGQQAVVGWIGGIRQYDGHVWELHPLVVRQDRREQGIGRALVGDLEERVRERHGLTVWLGTDDDADQTTLSGVDLYSNVGAHIAGIRNLARHPYEFYQKLGYVIVGVLPDANGIGRPDIYMAKPVWRSGST
ncbi:MAG: GNAT family N-acetyltransferase [Herpetosiphonaceae bacterium]|nr:GNAT family N-acetyltransferase [Herpetosiphonaceae bacterium]